MTYNDRKDKEEHCVTALEWRPEVKRRLGRPKTTWGRMVEDESKTAGWRHGRMSEPSQQTVVAVKALCALSLRHKEI